MVMAPMNTTVVGLVSSGITSVNLAKSTVLDLLLPSVELQPAVLYSVHRIDPC